MASNCSGREVHSCVAVIPLFDYVLLASPSWFAYKLPHKQPETRTLPLKRHSEQNYDFELAL